MPQEPFEGSAANGLVAGINRQLYRVRVIKLTRRFLGQSSRESLRGSAFPRRRDALIGVPAPRYISAPSKQTDENCSGPNATSLDSGRLGSDFRDLILGLSQGVARAV